MLPLASKLLMNPWVGLALLATLVATHLGAFFYGSSVGASFANLACEKRVTVINDDIAEKNKEIDRLNEVWEAAVSAVQETYNEMMVKSEADNAALEKKVTDYEDKVRNDPDSCRPIDRSDVDSLRR